MKDNVKLTTTLVAARMVGSNEAKPFLRTEYLKLVDVLQECERALNAALQLIIRDNPHPQTRLSNAEYRYVLHGAMLESPALKAGIASVYVPFIKENGHMMTYLPQLEVFLPFIIREFIESMRPT